MIISLELTEEQKAGILDDLTEAVALRLAEMAIQKRPLTVTEFAAATNLSVGYVRRHLTAGTIKRVPKIYKKLIPASELKPFQ
tara:strand:- start:332 stop:580 length:249 start_codon:yes stop_codon:yes gene_type:complete